jgi:lipid II:glycine glycyltransferase (peptidoglycan interpeptide bridge formation enzyme)
VPRLGLTREVVKTIPMQNRWQVEVDQATPEEWSVMLDCFDDANIYQTAAYGAVRWGEKNLSRLVLKRDGEAVAIAQLRVVRPTPFKFGIAYLRWGPLWEQRGMSLDPEVPGRMVRALEEEYLGKRRLFLRVLANAFVGTPRATVMRGAFGRFTSEPLDESNQYLTFLVDLSPSLEELRRQLDPKWRNKLAGAERNNLRVVSGSGSTEFRSFSQMYNEMRIRKTFHTTVDIEEFGRIQECLPESQRMRVLICEDNGVPVAGLVASVMGDTAIYLLGATSNDGLKSKGAYLLQWSMIQWLKETGVRWYDLGGIDPEGNPGVYQFKKGFSGMETCQINPLVASESIVSSGIVKAGLALQRKLRNPLKPAHFARSIKQMATRN